MNSWRDWKCSRYDILCLSAITIVGGLIRAWGIGTPGGYVLDEFYASDACLYIGGSPSLCRMPQELTIVQPPLGKWLIGSGISLLGFQPTGWRIASVVAGTLTIAALYLLARKVLNSTFAAAVASGLLAIDFLHFVFSRTAMLDVFVTFFIVIAFLFSAYDRERIFRSNRASHQLIWRMAAGTSVGAACASKWSAWPCLVALILLTVTWEFKALQADGRNPTVYKKILKASFSLFLCFVLLPALVYVLSYVGRLSGSLFTWPWAQDSWLRALMERQLMMFSFHVGLSGSHPYTSAAWSWILLKRPVLMYLRQPAEETYRVILGFGSPLVWWVSAAALIYLTLDWVRNRGIANSTSIIFVGFIATYGPWLLLGLRRQQVFLYYLLPTVPFMCLALGAIAARFGITMVGKITAAVFVACSMALFVYYYPLLVGKPLSYSSWESRMLFRNCTGVEKGTFPNPKQTSSNLPARDVAHDKQRQQEQRLHPQIVPGPPPAGWCWA